jgi:predicted enzyme related to lactoylglutathione lyase
MANAKLVFINVPSNDLEASRRFYKALIGEDFGGVLSDRIRAVQRVISPDGIALNISARHNPNEGVAAHFAVDNLEGAIQELQAAGAHVVAQPFDLPVSPQHAAEQFVHEWQKKAPKEQVKSTVGRGALVRDPDGNLVGLVELTYAGQVHYRAGQFRQPLTQEQQEANQHAQQVQPN